MDVSCYIVGKPERGAGDDDRSPSSEKQQSSSLSAEKWPRQNGAWSLWCCSPRWVRSMRSSTVSVSSEMSDVPLSYYYYLYIYCRVLWTATAAIPGRDDDCRHHSNIWRRQRRAVVGGGGGWRGLDYGNLTNAIRDIVEAMTVDCTLAVHSGVESTSARIILSTQISILHSI